MPHLPQAALVGAVSSRLGEAELTHIERTAIDVELARSQHRDYCATLEMLGLEIVVAPTEDVHPDAVFVEDVAVVVDGLALLTRPGAPSRRAEVARVAPVLAARGLEVAAIEAPGTLDGGDVLQVGTTLYVGLGTRTDSAGAERLRELVAPLGRRVVTVPVPGALHLKTAATALPDGRLVVVPAWVDTAALADHELVPAPEPAGASVLVVGESVVVSARAPATAELLTGLGHAVTTVDIGEFEKAEAGPTCLSLLLPARRG